MEVITCCGGLRSQNTIFSLLNCVDEELYLQCFVYSNHGNLTSVSEFSFRLIALPERYGLANGAMNPLETNPSDCVRIYVLYGCIEHMSTSWLQLCSDLWRRRLSRWQTTHGDRSDDVDHAISHRHLAIILVLLKKSNGTHPHPATPTPTPRTVIVHCVLCNEAFVPLGQFTSVLTHCGPVDLR